MNSPDRAAATRLRRGEADPAPISRGRRPPTPDRLTDDELVALLGSTRSVAIVGMSPDPSRPSHSVASYLHRHTDWTIWYVNPTVDEIAGRRAYATLADLPRRPDMVDVFRRLEHVPGVIDESIAVDARSVWLQLGLAHDDAAPIGRAAGLTVVEDRCLEVEHARLAHRLSEAPNRRDTNG